MRVFFASLLVLAAAAIVPEASAAESQVAKGRRLFAAVGCYQCHGRLGQGGAAGLKLAPEPLPYEALAQFVRGTTGAMPAYSEAVVSDADLTAIYAYLQSVPAPQPVQNLPLLRDMR